MHKLKRMLREELKRLEEEDFSEEMLDEVQKLTSSLKNICKIESYEEERDGGYSERRGYSMDGGRWTARGSYDEGGNSYRRRRDSMGRYSRAEGGYSEDGGKEGMVEYLEDMMHESSSPKEKEAIRKCIAELRGN